MKLIFISIFFLTIMFSCNKIKKTEPETLKYYSFDFRGSKSAKIFDSKIMKKTYLDSTYYMTVKSNNLRLNFTLPIKKSNDFDVDGITNGKLISQKEFEIDSEKFIVYKYYYKFKGNDGDELVFFSPKLGILIVKSVNWGNYTMLFQNGNENDFSKLLYINHKIITDCNFFNYE